MEKASKIAFLDGQIEIWKEDERGHRTLILRHLGYEERTVGSKRMYEAMQAGHAVSRVIRVPIYKMAVDGMLVREAGHTYQILQAQYIADTMPKCTQLTLENVNMIWDDPGAVEE